MKYKKEISAGGIVFRKLTTDLPPQAGNRKPKTAWLITQHSQHKGWTFPKGIIGDKNTDEKMEEAALREVGEEGGIKARIVIPNPIEVKYKYRFKDFLVDKLVHYFLMEYISGDPKDHDWEVSEAKFITADEIRKTLSFKSDQEAFEKILILFKNLKNE